MAANDNQLRRVKSDRCEGSLAERHLEHYLKIVIHVKAVELPIIQTKEQMSIIVGTEPNWCDLLCILKHSCEKSYLVRSLLFYIVTQNKCFSLWIIRQWVKFSVAYEE